MKGKDEKIGMSKHHPPIVGLGTVPISIVLLIIVLVITSISIASAYNIGGAEFSERKLITIDNRGNANTLTDYQVKIDVSYELEMQSDFDDLRFTDSSDTVLSYWIEKYTPSNSATVWVKVSSIPDSDTTTIYMYYGNAVVSGASDGVGTFTFFDDFEDGNLDEYYQSGGVWKVVDYEGSKRALLESGIARMQLVGKNVDIKNAVLDVDLKVSESTTVDKNIGLSARAQGIDPMTDNHYSIFWGTHPSFDEWILAMFKTFGTPDDKIFYCTYSGYSPETIWRHVTFSLYEEHLKVWVDNNLICDYSATGINSPGMVGLRGYSSGDLYWDNFRVREYTEPEPTVSIGANEAPVLSEGAVQPTHGDYSDIFEFSVIYTDEDGDEPVDAYVRVIGFKELNKVYDQEIRMVQTGGTPPEGASYAHTTNLPLGEYCYYFYFNDGHGHNAYLPAGGFPGFEGPIVYSMLTVTTTSTLGSEPLTIDSAGYVNPSAWVTWDRGFLEEPEYHINFRSDIQQEHEMCYWECIRRDDTGERTVYSYEWNRPTGASLDECLEQCKEDLEYEKQAVWDDMPTYTVYVRSMFGDVVPDQQVWVGSDEIAFEEMFDEWLAAELQEEAIIKVLEQVTDAPQVWGTYGTISWAVSGISFCNLLYHDSILLGVTDREGMLTFKFPSAGRTFVETDKGPTPYGSMPPCQPKWNLSEAIEDRNNPNHYFIYLTTWNQPDPFIDYEMVILGECPVDFEVRDPDGLTITKTMIQYANYLEFDINNDGEPDDLILIPYRKIGGDYQITVIPESDAELTDTYTLRVMAGDASIILGENVPISQISDQPYVIRSTETTIVQIIPATIYLEPETLNLKSNGEWITTYIELPEGYDVSNINVPTINLTNSSGDIITSVDLSAPATIGDYNGNSTSDLMVKFNRTVVVDYFGKIDIIGDGKGIDEEIELVITGELTDGTIFEGICPIRLIKRGK